jgi:hypothetical protein
MGSVSRGQSRNLSLYLIVILRVARADKVIRRATGVVEMMVVSDKRSRHDLGARSKRRPYREPTAHKETAEDVTSERGPHKIIFRRLSVAAFSPSTANL